MPVRGTNSLHFSTGLDNSGLQQGALDAVGIIQGLAGQISRINPFLGLAVGAATAFAAIGNSAYKMMREFESAMAEVKTIANVSESEFAKLEKRVFNLSKDLGTESPDALARGLYDIIGAGYEAADALELLEIASKAATAGVTTSAVAADGLTTILNAFQLEAKDAAEVADIMFATVDRGKISFEELSSQIAQVAPLAASSGFSFEQIGGAIATLTKQGVPASQAMTQIRSAIIATNEVMGDGISQSMTLQQAFQAMYDKAGGSQNQLQELAGRIEAVNAILSIAGPNFEGAAEDLAAMGEAAGSVDRSFKIITSTTENQWKILGNRIKATTEEIGSSIVQVSSHIAGFINRALDETEDVTVAIREQANEYNILRRTLEDTNTPFEEKLRILRELKDQYPEYLRSLDLDKVSNDNLETTLRNVAGALKDINDEHERRLKLSGASQRELEAEASRNTYQQLYDEQKARFFGLVEELKRYAAENNIELEFSYSDDIGKIYRDIDSQIKGGPFSEGRRLVADLLNARQSASTFAGHVNSANKELRESQENAEAVKRSIYDNAEGYEQVYKWLQKIKDAESLKPYELYSNEEIKRAVSQRRAVISQMRAIDNIGDVESLKPFLESELEEIREYAEKREKILNPPSVRSRQATQDDKSFADMLKAREKEYQKHAAAVKQLGKEVADSMFEPLLEEGATFGEFLQNLVDQSRSAGEKIAIALAAETAGINLSRPSITPVGTPDKSGPVFDIAIDETTINYIERQIQRLTEQFNAANEADRPDLGRRIEYWEERLRLARGGAQEEENIYSNLRRGLFDLNNAQLRDYIKYWKDRLKEAEKGSKEEKEALDNIRSAEIQIGTNTSNVIRAVSGSLSQASDMFRKFGEGPLADALDKLSGLANNMAGIIANVSSGNWIGVVGGAIGVISSLISGSGDRKELSAYDKSINRLEKSVDRLSKSLSRLYGAEQLAARQKIIEDLEIQETTIENEIKRAKNFIAKYGGENSFTLPVVLELAGLEEDLKDVQDRIYDANEDLRDAATGTTQDSIADAIVQGFKDGKRSIEDFADTFEDTMRNAILHTFKENFLRDQLKAFYSQFAEMNADGLTNSEISSLENLFNEVITGTQSSIESINQILENAGFDPIGLNGAQDQRQGLAGAITNITEDTANVLEGYLNAVRLDVRQGLEVAIQNSQYLSQIANNTSYLISMDRLLQSIDGRFASIEGSILEFQAQG